MSFDLSLQKTPRPDALAALVKAHSDLALAEVVAGDTYVLCSFGSTTTDAQMRRSYAALVELAKEHGLRLMDPQAGGALVDLSKPKRHPPGWETQLSPSAFRNTLDRLGMYNAQARLHRVRNLNAIDKAGEHLFVTVLRRGAGASAKSKVHTVAQDMLIAMLDRGADPLSGGAHDNVLIYYIVEGDMSRVLRRLLDDANPSDAGRLLSCDRYGPLHEYAKRPQAHKVARLFSKLNA